jgi:hypothetical protein
LRHEINSLWAVKMAKRGRPKGAWSEKRFKDALSAAVSQKEKGVPRLRLIAEQLAKAAMDGDVMAIREVADRLDGKAKQQIDAVVREERMVVEAPQREADPQEWAGKHGPH